MFTKKDIKMHKNIIVKNNIMLFIRPFHNMYFYKLYISCLSLTLLYAVLNVNNRRA